jgi:hypothetical protein
VVSLPLSTAAAILLGTLSTLATIVSMSSDTMVVVQPWRCWRRSPWWPLLRHRGRTRSPPSLSPTRQWRAGILAQASRILTLLYWCLALLLFLRFGSTKAPPRLRAHSYSKEKSQPNLRDGQSIEILWCILLYI